MPSSTRKHLFIIAGMSRGGTNLLWNIVQSHPDIIDTYFELNEILGKKTNISLQEKINVELAALANFRAKSVGQFLRTRLEYFANYSFQNDDYNREKSPGYFYKKTDVNDLNICTKLVSAWETDPFRKLLRRNDALKYLPLLSNSSSQVKVIFLVRNGLAVAEGWGRRGANIDVAAYWYRKYILFYEQYVKENPNSSMIVKFEDVIEFPFRSAEEIYNFLNLSSTSLENLRIAIKPTVNSNQHIKNTTEKEKVWINEKNKNEFLDEKINDIQINKIASQDRKRFLKVNEDLMTRYAYL